MRSKLRYRLSDEIGGRYQAYRALMGDISLRGTGGRSLPLPRRRAGLPVRLKTFQQRYPTNPKLRAAFENEVAT